MLEKSSLNRALTHQSKQAMNTSLYLDQTGEKWQTVYTLIKMLQNSQT